MLRYLESDQGGGPTPAAFFLHFGADFRSGAAAAAKHREFFEFTGMDFVKIQLELDFPHTEVVLPAEYANLPALTPELFAPQLAVVKELVDALKTEALIVLTLYSPFMVLAHMVEAPVLHRHLAEEPEAVFKGLEIVTDGMLEFVRACVKAGVDGFYHSTQGGEARRFHDPDTFLKWIKPTDHRVMNEIAERCLFNILHVCDYHQEYGGYGSLKPFLDYPGHVVNISTRIGDATLSPSELSAAFARPYMGGLDRLGALATGSPDSARAAAREVLALAPPKFILGADCTVPGDTPWENLRAAIDEAHRGRHG